jgi:chromosome segregation ATPase
MAAVLQSAAARTGSSQLALIAASAQLDAFTKVKAEIDRLVAELGQQQKDEVAHRDACIEDINTNTKSTAAADDKKTSLQTKIADLESTIKTLTADIESSTAAVAEMQEQMKRASETREAENADYHQTIEDQRMTQAILDKALARMKQVYALLQKPGAPHIQTSGTHTDPGNGPARFTKYEQNAGGNRVVAAIEEIIADSRKTEDEAISAEEDAQTAYENFMKESNKGITQHTKAITNMSAAKAKAKEALSMAKSDLTQTVLDLEGLYETLGDLHKACDYILDNFDARQAARAAEIEALNEAKAILSGMK